jgi:retinol dehydrogenase-12
MSLSGKTYFLTGPTSGIGRATAESLGARGANLVLAARSPEKAAALIAALKEKSPQAEFRFLQIDLSDLKSVRRAAEEYLASGRPLDVLINNAGLAGVQGLTRDGFELTVGTNHLGPFLLTEKLLPLLQKSAEGRVINVASRAHSRVRGLSFDKYRRPAASKLETLKRYGQSKLMNVIHARELGRQLAGTSVTTYAVHPGVVASEIWRALPAPLDALLKLFMITNEEGARTSLYCATEPSLRAQTGRYYDKCREVPANRVADDPELTRRLFAWSQESIRSALAS